MDAREHLRGTGPGDLVAISMPPGPDWMPVLEEAWASGAAVLPLDHRLRLAEVRSIVDRARPGLVLDADGATVRTEGAAVEEGTAIVLATSGTAGVPKVVELGARGRRGRRGREPRRLWGRGRPTRGSAACRRRTSAACSCCCAAC